MARELTGAELRDALIAASDHLEFVASSIDAINVYPVPDGDTGSNMAGTVREAIAALRDMPDDIPAGDVLVSVSKASLYSARGNSGVILSQAFRGLAMELDTAESISGGALATALEHSATAAYGAVSEPKEGTMLTVLRAAAEGAAGISGADIRDVLASALHAAEAAAANTINQMDLLREAGVTDAGGEGVCALLRGMVAFLDGSVAVAASLPSLRIALRPEHETDDFGYCTEFVLESRDEFMPIDELAVHRIASDAAGRSLVTIGDRFALRVHVHVDQPQALLDDMASLGVIVQPKFDDMAAQRQQLSQSGSGAGSRVALLALCQGDGMHQIFRELGARTLDLGTVTKPSAGQIAEDADALGTPTVVVLPNHANVLLAAEQSISLARSNIQVVPTRTMAEGVAAGVAFDPAGDANLIIGTLKEAARCVTTIEVSKADATRTISGVSVKLGDFVAILDGELVAAEKSLEAAALAGMMMGPATEAELATIYSGMEAGNDQRQMVLGAIQARFPDLDIEVVDGGQSIYTFIVALE